MGASGEKKRGTPDQHCQLDTLHPGPFWYGSHLKSSAKAPICVSQTPIAGWHGRASACWLRVLRVLLQPGARSPVATRPLHRFVYRPVFAARCRRAASSRRILVSGARTLSVAPIKRGSNPMIKVLSVHNAVLPVLAVRGYPPTTFSFKSFPHRLIGNARQPASQRPCRWASLLFLAGPPFPFQSNENALPSRRCLRRRHARA